MQALSQKHDGSVLDHLSQFLAQGDTQDGNGIGYASPDCDGILR